MHINYSKMQLLKGKTPQRSWEAGREPYMTRDRHLAAGVLTSRREGIEPPEARPPCRK